MKLRRKLALSLLAIAVPLVASLAWWREDRLVRDAEEEMRTFVLARMEDGGRARCEANPEVFPDPPGGRPMRAMPGGRVVPGERGASGERTVSGEHGVDGERGVAGERGMHGESDPPSEAAREDDVRTESDVALRPPRPPRARLGAGPSRLPPGAPIAPGPGRIEMFAYYPDLHSANASSPAFPPELARELESGVQTTSTEWRIAGVGGMQVALRMPWSDGPCAVMLARRHGVGPGAESAAQSFLWSALALCAVLFGAVLFAAGPIVRRVRTLTSEVRRSADGCYATPVDDAGDDEIAELARAFNSAGSELRTQLAELESREATLRAFVENTTHDVMLPLTVLQGHLTALRNRLDAGEAIEREVVLDSLEEAHYLASLVQNLGVAAKLEAGAKPGTPGLHKHPFRLDALVERVVGRHRPIAKQRAIQLDFALPEGGVSIEGDVTLLEQAVSNVVHNAVRYNEAGGHVLVLLERRGDAAFVLRVIDDGPGVSEEMLARLSERSFRTDEARRRHPDGMGLGLAIAHDVAARHGFTFAIRRSEHGGLEVEVGGPCERLAANARNGSE